MKVYIVSYDIANDKRRRKIFEYLRKWGNHLQYSVFRCELNNTKRAKMVATLKDIIDCDDDQVLLFDLGPIDGRAEETVISLGADYTHPERHAIVL